MEQPDLPDNLGTDLPTCFSDGTCPCAFNPFCNDPGGGPVNPNPPCNGQCDTEGCPACPDEPEPDPPTPPTNLQKAKSFIECGKYYILNLPDHYLDKATGKVHSIQGQIVRDPTPTELSLLTTTAPACSYDLGDSYYNPIQGKIFDYDGTEIDNVQDENIEQIRERLPEGMIDLGFGFFDPASKGIFNYGGTQIKTASPAEVAIILQQPPEGTFPFPPNYYNANTGFIHNLFGRKLNRPTAEQILRLISQPPANPPTATPTPNVAPTINTLESQIVREDQIIPDINIESIVSDSEDPNGELSLRVFSGEPEKLTATVIQNLIARLILVPNATGTVPVTFTIEDTDGLESSQTINVDILPVNDAPTIITNPPTVSSSRIEYIYDLRGFDVDADPITFQLFRSPTNVVLTPTGAETARVTFQPEERGLTETITVLVRDNNGGQGYQSWQVDIR